MKIEHCYGRFPGGDPRWFEPDPECCTPAEIDAWREACACWDAGEQVDCGGGCDTVAEANGSVASSFGIGSYAVVRDEGEELAAGGFAGWRVAR